MEGYADRPALGQRAHELVTDDATGRTIGRLLPRFETITYHELWTRAGAVASAWQHTPVGAGDFVAIMGFASTDYTTLELAVHPPWRGVGAAADRRIGRPAGVDHRGNGTAEFWPLSTDFLDSAVESVLAGFDAATTGGLRL